MIEDIEITLICDGNDEKNSKNTNNSINIDTTEKKK
jgi:hypothetical protein